MPAPKKYVKKSAPATKVVYVAAAPAKRSYTRRSTVGSLKGKGDYTYDKPGPWGKFGRSMGGQAGAMVGSNYGMGGVGKAIGGKLGSYLHYIGKIFGSGDYITSPNQVKNNILVNQSQVPAFQDGKNSVRIAHREFLGDVISSGTAGAFQITQYPINPGLKGTFPWLAQVVGSTFQQYRLNGMVYEFRSMSSDALNSTNTALGSVVMCTDYDSKDTPFTTKQQMENTEFGVSCKPSSCMIHGIECARSQTSVSELYIRAFAVPTGADVRLYDMGNFYIATQGMQGTSVNLGELWVSYDITFLKTIEQVPGFLIPTAAYALDPATMATAPLKALAGGNAFDTVGITINTLGTKITWPLTTDVNSIWLIEFILTGTATANLNAFTGQALLGGMVSLESTFSTPSPNGSLTSSRQTFSKVVQYQGGGTVAVPPSFEPVIPGTMMSAYSSGRLIITQLNGSYVGF